MNCLLHFREHKMEIMKLQMQQQQMAAGIDGEVPAEKKPKTPKDKVEKNAA